MISYPYAKQANPDQWKRISSCVMLDSGGFASLFSNATIVESEGLGTLVIETGGSKNILTPHQVLALQQEIADIGIPLDFLVTEAMSSEEVERRQRLTRVNALWALSQMQPPLKLFAPIQALTLVDAQRQAHEYLEAGFIGLSLGGMVPRMRSPEGWDAIVDFATALRQMSDTAVLHVLGSGQPQLVQRLADAGVDLVDSSSWVRAAVDGISWRRAESVPDLSDLEAIGIAIDNLQIGRAALLQQSPPAIPAMIAPLM